MQHLSVRVLSLIGGRDANLLIRDGAHPVLDSADLVEELEMVQASGSGG